MTTTDPRPAPGLLDPAVAALVTRHTESDPHAAWGQCAIRSDELMRDVAISAPHVRTVGLRVTGATYGGREHWALALLAPGPHYDLQEALFTATVVDTTCRQFRADAPAPYVADLDTWLDDCCEWLSDDVDLAAYTPAMLTVGGRGEPFWTETRSREDVEPGPLTYAWEIPVKPGPATYAWEIPSA